MRIQKRSLAATLIAGLSFSAGAAHAASSPGELIVRVEPPLAIRALAQCGIGNPFTLGASASTVTAGQSFNLTWCDPTFGYLDSAYSVNSYALYFSLQPASGYQLVSSIPSAYTSVGVNTTSDQAGLTLYLFIRSFGTSLTVGGSVPLNKDTNVVSVTVQPAAGGGGGSACTADSSTLCLFSNRFKATATFMRYSSNAIETASAHAYSDTTGFFSTVLSSDVDVVVKMVNFCSLNGSWSAYIGGTTDLEVDITIVDTSTGRTYHAANALGNRWLLIRDTAFSCP
jgi:hypothetical protein